ncbi:MAG: GNAT family N-acetyltransferase [Desulfovibrionaceae bacterium]|nr:GNAT family N-acetyltransferase [Desulfovibrionaceae bacterium]
MGITLRTERFETFRPDAAPLARRHWEESASGVITEKPAVDAALYHKMDAAGMLHITTARDGATLVGYAVYILSPTNQHYRGMATAESDAFFLLPEYRRGWDGLRMLQHAEAMLAARGVVLISQRFPASREYGALFRRMGYRLEEHLYMRRL